jgi:predicted DNA binding protein
MVFELVISTDIERHWIGEITRLFPVHVSLKDVIIDESGLILNLIDIDLRGVSPELVTDSLKDIENVESVQVSEVSEGKIVAVVGLSRCEICRALMESGCFFNSARNEDGSLIWTFIAPQKLYARKLESTMNDLGINFELIKILSLREKAVLTQRQEELLRVAFEGGYFDFPKKMGVRELANQMDSSSASVSETLRKAVRTLVERHLSEM